MSSRLIANVSCMDWHAIVKRDDTCERQWECFSTKLNSILDMHAPARRFRVHNPSPPAVSDDTLKLVNHRRNAEISAVGLKRGTKLWPTL